MKKTLKNILRTGLITLVSCLPVSYAFSEQPTPIYECTSDKGLANLNATASLGITLGTKKQSRVNFAVGIGASKTRGNFMGGANLSLNLYNGGPGTTQATTGKNSLGGVITLGLSGTYGRGSGRSTDLNIFNSTTPSAITNNFKNSGTIGTNLTYNTATGFNRDTGFACKFGGFTATIYEDYSPFPKEGLLASGLDEGETGGGFMGFTFKNGTSISAGAEIFTGKPLSYPKPSQDGYVLQKPNQADFNVGRTFLKVEDIPNFGNIRFDYSGQSQMWFQNALHNLIGMAHFKSFAEDSFQITLEKLLW